MDVSKKIMLFFSIIVFTKCFLYGLSLLLYFRNPTSELDKLISLNGLRFFAFFFTMIRSYNVTGVCYQYRLDCAFQYVLCKVIEYLILAILWSLSRFGAIDVLLIVMEVIVWIFLYINFEDIYYKIQYRYTFKLSGDQNLRRAYYVSENIILDKRIFEHITINHPGLYIIYLHC